MHVASNGDGRPLIFIHGLGWDRGLWRRQLEQLAPSYRVIAADTRGHGRTEKPAGPYSIGQFAADWAGLLDALGLRRVALVGFSQGGIIAQMLALERPDLVGALVLAATTCRGGAAPDAMSARAVALAQNGAADAARIAAEQVFSDSWRAANPGAVATFIARRAAADPAPLRAAMSAARGLDLGDRLQEIRAPTLVIYAPSDRMMPPAATREIAERVPGAAVVSISDSGHMIPIEQPEAFDRALGDFLKVHWPTTETISS